MRDAVAMLPQVWKLYCGCCLPLANFFGPPWL